MTSYFFNRKYTLIYLLLLILLAFAIRSVWYYDAAYTGGPSPLLSGNDPDYHKRTVDYFATNHHFLMRDPLLNYPGGGPNPNPPAYSTSVALLGHAMTPFFGGNLEDALWFSMEIGAALWAALTVIPVYLFTKEMFGRKSAYVSAFFIAVMAGNVERTPLGFSDHDAFFMFFIVTGFFFFLKALRRVKTKVYVKSWRDPREVTLGLTDFAKSNQVGLLYASMAGMSLAAVALSWKGFPYALAIVFVYMLFHLLVNKFRRIDNTAIGLTVLTTVSIMMLLAMPYYIAMDFMNWYEAPAILFAGTCLVVAVFLFTRDLPWLLIIPVLLLIIVVVFTVVWFLLPDVWINIFSGAGYFIRTKLYGTIAEAQPPDINRLVFSYGMTTFFLALVGVFIMIKNLPKGWKNDQIFTTIWALVSVYMAVAAIRFMYNATPVFAILGGWITYDIIHRLDFRRMFRVFRSMKGDFIKALRAAVKLRHVTGVLFLAFLIVAPNMWHGVDAGIPYETKKEADLKVYNALPEFMRPAPELYDPDSNSLWYLGSFGTSFMSDYWAQGMWWLAEQDTWQDEEDRPAFISWWDYGHWCVNVGKHPTAADNFQNGVEFAGNFIASQGEDQAMALMLVRLFQLNQNEDEVLEYMEEQLGDLPGSDGGMSVSDELKDLFVNAESYTKRISKFPERYGLKDKEINWRNVVFIHGTWLMEKKTTVDHRIDMLLWFRNQMGDEFRYFAVDSRLMPTSYRNTGIFYAPITLSDNRVDEFIEIVAIHNGNQITLDQAAALPAIDRQNLQYQLVWKRQFFESMFYRTFIGYSGYDQGPEFKDTGIPFITGDLARNTPLPGWNMSHWRVVHRTIHWNPWPAKDVQQHQQDWEAISYEEALRRFEDNEGLDEDNKTVIDDAIRSVSSGVIYLKYYAGANISGTVLTESGEPVQGATITVHDDYRFFGGYMGPDFMGIPHGTTQTDENGHYSILAPFGNVTLVASNGGSMEYTLLHERNVLNQTNIYISDDAAMRVGDYNFTVDMLVPTAYQNGTVYADVNDNGAFDKDEDERFGNATITLKGLGGLNKTVTLTTYPDGYFELEDALPGEYQVSVEYKGHLVEDAGRFLLGTNETKEEDLIIRYSDIFGTIIRMDGKDVEGTEVTVRDLQTNETFTEEAEVQGDYSFDTLLPGNYSVELYVPGTRPFNETVILANMDTKELNITLLPTAFIEGSAFTDANDNGEPDPGEGLVNATITFHRLYSDDLVWTISTNETGHYNTSLPTGNYSTYIHESLGSLSDDIEHLAAFKTLDVDADDWSYAIDFELLPSYLVNGRIKRAQSETNDTLINVSRSPVQIWYDGGRLEVMANQTGYFSIYLPEGTYSLFTSKVVTDRPLVNLTRIEVESEDIEMGEIVITNGTRLEGHAYFDRNGNTAVNQGEGQGDIMILFEADGHLFNATTIENGSFAIDAAPLNYTVTIDAPAFDSFTSVMDASGNVLPTKKNFDLQPFNVTYTGTAGFDWDDDGNLSGDGFPGLLVSFEAKDPDTNPNAVTINVTTDAEGIYEVNIAPGRYKVKVELDRDEDLGTFRYSHDLDLDVKPSTDNKTYNVWLERLVRINGTITTEEGNTSINTNIRFEGIENTVKVRDGTFDDHVPVGTHILLATHYESTSSEELDRFELETEVDVDRPLKLNLTMYQVVHFKGNLYYDWNGNGQFDPLPTGDDPDPDIKDEGRHMPRFVLQGIRDHEVYPQVNGSFDTKVFPHDNYTLFLERKEFDVDDEVEYQWFMDGTIDLTRDTEVDLPLQRRIEVTGRVYWDIDENNISTPEEAIADVNVTLTSKDGSVSYETTTGPNGIYRQFVFVDTEGTGDYELVPSHPGFTPNQTMWELAVTPKNFSRDLQMQVIDIAINGTTFLDQNENGKLNRYEFPIQVDHIEIWDSTNSSVHHGIDSDANGTFSLELPPGEYNILAWTEEDGGHIVHLSVITIEPTGDVHNLSVPLTPGHRVSGIMYFHNQTGVNDTVPEVDLTFTALDGVGVVPIVTATSGGYGAVLPDGRYRVNGSYTNEEFGVDMRYEIDEDFRMVLNDRSDVDLNFSKVDESKLEMWWDDLPVFLDENTSYNLTIFAKNTGSVNATFDLTAELPDDWTFELELDNVTLNMSENTSFWAVVNSSERATAMVHTITFQAIPRGSNDDPSKMELAITINQHYGFELRTPEDSGGFYLFDRERKEHHISYQFIVENKGNGRESLNITVSTVLDWTIELPSPELSLEPYDIQPNIPIEVTVPTTTELNAQTLVITAVPSNDPDPTPVSMELKLTFPDLYISKGDVNGDVEGEQLEWPKDAPGFGPLVALAAVGLAALVAVRRRRL
jgi:dolichyl-diphosphooligosaccharide--protein glycosyltransferase